SFGQSAQMPQIYRGFGIDSSLFWRGVSDDMVDTTEFIWKGSDLDLIAVDKIETHLRYLQNNCEECKVYPDFVLLCKIVDYTQIYV
ncbi:hypothetical protein ACTPD5_21710, partial [Clostridioides difficile]|uniref:glycoside hydrolase family 38 N-terminal domain-containing protein n=1 Tax=Clostridioides difficile TaxID=1496 RepID=UPI003F8D68C3